MTEESVSERPRKKHDPRRQGRSNLFRYDEALLASKNAQKVIALDLAMSTRFTDEDGTVEGRVCQVDRYSVEIEITSSPGSGRKVWIAKSMIVGTEVL